MILASHGIIASSILQVDADWLAYYNRVIAAGGSLTTTEQNATKTLVADLKANGLWTPMKAIYPMVGASAAACAQNLKSASFEGTFTATGWTFASTGITGNGTSAFFDTTFNNQANWTSTLNGSMGFVSRTNESSSVCDMGAGNITSGANSSTIFAGFLGTYYGGLNCTTVAPGASNTSTIGFFATSRISSSDYAIYKRGSSIINLTTTDSIGTNPNQNIYLGAGNNGGSASRFSNKEFNFCFIGDGLTQTEVDNYWTALQTFNSTLSR